jgi:thiol-disulfide isomerase/thioredoxin
VPGSGRRRGGALLLILGLAVLAAIAVAAVRAGDDSSGTSTPARETVGGGAPGSGVEAPDFTLRRLRGPGTVTLSDHRGGVVLLNFWASWCAPCKEEFPTLRGIVADHPKVEVIGITYRDIDSDARRFAEEERATWTLLRGGDGDPVAKEYRIRAVPQLYVLDAEGRIVERIFGGASTEEIEDAIADADAAT